MRTSRVAVLATATLILGAAFSVRVRSVDDHSQRSLLGPPVKVGDGAARTFVEMGTDGRPTLIGITFDQGAMRGLPGKMNSASRCFDKNGDRKLTHGECVGDYQFNLAMPEGSAKLDLPFKYATVNWNPEGHMAPASPVWSAAHYDFRFFIVEASLIDAIRTGPCAELIHCDDFKRASVPLPKRYQPQDYIDVG